MNMNSASTERQCAYCGKAHDAPCRIERQQYDPLTNRRYVTKAELATRPHKGN